MTLECPKCSARYNIQDSLIPEQGARVKCKKCGTVMSIPAPVVELAPHDLELIPPPGPVSSPSGPVLSPSNPEPLPRVSAPPSAPPDAAFERGFGGEPESPASSQDSGIVVDRPFEGTSTLPPADPQFERARATPARFGSPPPFSESEAPPPLDREPLPGLDTSMAMSAPTVAAEERPAPIAAPEAARATAAAPEAARATAAAPEAPAASPSPVPTGTPIPAGLSQDDQSKHEKARRLARVLASDIAIYNRDKRDRGMREGNLVAVLGYEIKKSWEVYKERVGSEFANSTPYFRDALNEMLAEGKKIF